MTILLTSDLHFRLPWLEWLVSEAKSGRWNLIGLGGDQEDLLNPSGKQKCEWEKVFAGVLRLGVPVVACGGNHDRFSRGVYLPGSPVKLTHAFDVPGLETVVIGSDLMVTICPWNFARWSALETIVKQRQGRRWLILVHQPPLFHSARETPKVEEGMSDEWVDRLQPDFIFSGHIHHLPYASDFAVRRGKTWSLNAGQCEPVKVPNYIELDLTKNTATWNFYDPVEVAMASRSVRS